MKRLGKTSSNASKSPVRRSRFLELPTITVSTTTKKRASSEMMAAWQTRDSSFQTLNSVMPLVQPKGTPINFHLMVSPDDIEHVDQVKRFLRKLTFKAGDDEYGCSRDEIIRLGRHHTRKHLDDPAAFAAGAKQFKVSPDQFLKKWADSPWMQKNALIAIAAGSGDGTSGLQRDDSLAALRQKLERSAHVIFSSNPKDRDFWLGKVEQPFFCNFL